MSSPKAFASRNPFPGLRPFHEDEEHLFFGREKQVDAMVDTLNKTHFLTVVGTSGSGKSSLVNCGLRPALYRGWMPNAGTDWRIAQFTPGSNPIRMMAEALAKDGVLYSGFKSEDFSLAEFIESGLRTSKLGLITAFEHARLGSGVNLLVVADQFEELFRYQKAAAFRNEPSCGPGTDATALVNLLLEVREHLSLPIYVALTMRSDFLGDCAQFFGLPEAMNRGQYLVPRMSRDERRLAIVGPVGVGGAQIDPALATRLVNDVGDNPDQLSILQHALNRTWARWELETEPRGPLELKHYEAIGTVAHALDGHAERAFAELNTERKRKICEKMMKALTDWGTDARGTRRPTKLKILCGITQASAEEVIEVIEVFRKPSRSFLMPPAPKPLDGEKVIDISHESLMRVWGRLRTWGEEESASDQMYRRIRDWALRWDKGNADLWRGPDLASAIAWREREKPSPEWAECYGPREDLQLALRFLDASEQSRRAAADAEEAKRQAQLRHARHSAIVSGVVTASLVAGMLLYLAAYRWDHIAYYNSSVKEFGVPRGIGKLTSEQIKHRALSYKITTQGYLGPVLSMQAVNAEGQPAIGYVRTGFEMSDENFQNQSRSDYVYDRQGLVAYEVSFDQDNHRVRSIIYAPSEQKLPVNRSAYMISREGSMALQAASCAAFIKYEYSKEGQEIATVYLDPVGKPTTGRDNVFVMQRNFDQQGNESALISLWKDRSKMNDKVGNAEMRVSYDALGNVVSAQAFDAAGAPINLRGEMWQRHDLKYDHYGNVVEEFFWQADESPGVGDDECHHLQYTYDDHGNIVQVRCVDQDTNKKYAIWKLKYDNNNRRTEWTYYDKDGQPAKGPDGAHQLTVAYDTEGNTTAYAFFDVDGKPTTGISGFHKQTASFENGHEVRRGYFDINGKPFVFQGYTAIEKHFDSHGYEDNLSYLDSAGKPVRSSAEDYAIRQSSYDSCGRVVEKRFLDEHGKPVRSKIRGYAVMRQSYDEGNNVNEEAYFDENDRPARSADGYERITRRFDRHGNIIEEGYFDSNGTPQLKGKYSRVTKHYDDHNQLLEEAYFGSGENPGVNVDGWTRITHVMNALGKEVETRYLGIEGKSGKLERRSGTPTRNPLIEEAFFGANGQPAANKDGWTRITHVVSAEERDTETRYFGLDGKSGKLEKRSGHNSDRDAVIEETYLGPNGDPVLTKDGWARITYVNDERGEAIERAHFGPSDEPVIGNTLKFHRAKRVLDKKGNVLEVAYFGIDGKPLAFKQNDDRFCARVVMHYDNKDEQTSFDCYDTVGKRLP